MLLYKKNLKLFLLSVVCLSYILPIQGYALDVQPFLYLPFSYKYYNIFNVTEGWKYSWSIGYLHTIGIGEYFIHGKALHGSVDYALPYWTPVLAPMDWYLIASYQNELLKEKWYVRTYQWLALHYGLGWYVQIWNPANNIFVILWHLSSIDKSIPVSPAVATWWKKWVTRRDPTSVTFNATRIQQMIDSTTVYPYLVYVKKWQRIWTIWLSGIEWWDWMRNELPIPRDPEYPALFSWDEPHLHLEVFHVQDGQKALVDPYNIYSDFHGYPDSNTIRTSLYNMLFVQTEKWRIRFADEK